MRPVLLLTWRNVKIYIIIFFLNPKLGSLYYLEGQHIIILSSSLQALQALKTNKKTMQLVGPQILPKVEFILYCKLFASSLTSLFEPTADTE